MTVIESHRELGVPAGSSSLARRYRAAAGAVPQARHDVVRVAVAAGFEGEQLDAVALAVSEALTNAVLYAYQGEPREIDVTAEMAGDELWVLVADEGAGLRTDTHSDGLGLGLALISELADELVLAERASGGIEVRMRFRLVPGLTPEDPPQSPSTRPGSFSTTR